MSLAAFLSHFRRRRSQAIKALKTFHLLACLPLLLPLYASIWRPLSVYPSLILRQANTIMFFAFDETARKDNTNYVGVEVMLTISRVYSSHFHVTLSCDLILSCMVRSDTNVKMKRS